MVRKAWRWLVVQTLLLRAWVSEALVDAGDEPMSAAEMGVCQTYYPHLMNRWLMGRLTMDRLCAEFRRLERERRLVRTLRQAA